MNPLYSNIAEATTVQGTNFLSWFICRDDVEKNMAAHTLKPTVFSLKTHF
jgi:hypothetical protein